MDLSPNSKKPSKHLGINQKVESILIHNALDRFIENINYKLMPDGSEIELLVSN